MATYMEATRQKALTPPKIGDSLWTKLGKNPERYIGYEFPRVTVVIPSYNCAHSITRTLQSLFKQEYNDLEIIVIDAGSTDRTIQLVHSWPSVRLYSVYRYHLYEMLNKGIQLATGRYINFLYPGDFYIQKDVLRDMMMLAIDNDQPHLVFAGTLIREGTSEVRVLYRPLDQNWLKLGHQPTSLESCWFRSDLFKELGEFNESYQLRGGFDLFCRFVLHGSLKAVSTSRVMTDYELRRVTYKGILLHFWESLQVIHARFGTWATLRWLVRQRDLIRFLRAGMHSIRLSLLGAPEK